MTGRGKAGARPTGPDKDAADADTFIGPSPDPKTNLLLANIVLTGGAELVRRGMERGLLGKRYAPEKARKILKGRSLGESLAGAAVARLALRSVPGAILVGGGLLAKTLFDRRRSKAALDGGPGTAEEIPIANMADDDDTGGY